MPEAQEATEGNSNQPSDNKAPQENPRGATVVPPEITQAATPREKMQALAEIKQEDQEPVVTADLMQKAGNAVIDNMTRAYLNEIGVDSSKISPDEYRRYAHEATSGQCIYTCAMAGLSLRDMAPGRFSEMLLVQSRVADDTEEGKKESEEWYFDTWLVVREKETGQYFTMSPALHDMPEEKNLVSAYTGNSLADTVKQIKAQRPHWEWPSGEEISAYEEFSSRHPDNFYKYDPTTQEHNFNTLATDRVGGDILIDDRPYALPSLEPFD